MSSDESDLTPESIKLDALGIVNNLLPEKSKEKYLKAYDDFHKWKTAKGAKSVSESVLLVYFEYLSCTKKSSSLCQTKKKRKTTRGEWSQESMTAALDAVKNGMVFQKASKEFSVPIMSLKRRAKAKNKIAVGAVKYLGGKRTTFTKEQDWYKLITKLED